jgi:hypothetical protein
MTEDDDGDRSGKSGDIARRVVAGVAVTGVASLLGHHTDILAAGITPITEVGAGRFLAEWSRTSASKLWRDKLRRAQSAVDAACDEGGITEEQLAALADENEETRQMTEDVLNAASSSTWPPHVRALGRLLVKGLLAEGADKVLYQNHALPAMKEMNRLHVSMLDLVVNYGPPPAGSEESEPVPYKPNPNVPEGSFNTGNRTWTIHQITTARPELVSIHIALTGMLIRHGLIFQRDKTREALSQLARLTENRANQRAAVAQGKRRTVVGPPSAPTVDRVITPTSLGEQVISFYREAAAELDSITAAGQDSEAPDGTSGPGGSAG